MYEWFVSLWAQVDLRRDLLRVADHEAGAVQQRPHELGDRLQVDVMTPHQTHYYAEGESPHDSGQPNPIVPPDKLDEVVQVRRRIVQGELAVQGLPQPFGLAAQVFFDPQHPYTQTLIASNPQPDPRTERERRRATPASCPNLARPRRSASTGRRGTNPE